jgi:hypothetical protein
MNYDIYNHDFKGWIENPHEVNATLATMPAPLFVNAPGASELKIKGNDPVLLYKNVRAVIGTDAPKGPQGIGDCVSWGFGGMTNYFQCVQISIALRDEGLFGSPQEEQNEFLKSIGISTYEEIATESIYALSRVEVGGQRGSYSDGSVGAWAAKALTDYGLLSRPELSRLGLSPDYNPKRAKDWGAKGLPDNLEPTAKKHPYKIMSSVRSFNDLAKLIENGKPTAICSNRGFSMIRDRQGFCSQKGTWYHCMFAVAVRYDRPGALLAQSWGPNTPSGPTDLEQPDNTFWVDEKVLDGMLRQGDSFSGDEFEAYQSRDPSIWYH